jgi:hypothetical protein
MSKVFRSILRIWNKNIFDGTNFRFVNVIDVDESIIQVPLHGEIYTKIA